MIRELHYIEKQEKQAERKALKLYHICTTAHFGDAIIRLYDDMVEFDEIKLKELKKSYLLEMSQQLKKVEE